MNDISTLKLYWVNIGEDCVVIHEHKQSSRGTRRTMPPEGPDKEHMKFAPKFITHNLRAANLAGALAAAQKIARQAKR